MNEAVEEVVNLEEEQEDELIKTKQIFMNLEQKGIEKTTLRELGYRFTKRIFDVICGLIGVICLIPIGIIIKIINMLSGDFYPIIFTQNRIGKNGREFKALSHDSHGALARHWLRQGSPGGKEGLQGEYHPEGGLCGFGLSRRYDL